MQRSIVSMRWFILLLVVTGGCGGCRVSVENANMTPTMKSVGGILGINFTFEMVRRASDCLVVSNFGTTDGIACSDNNTVLYTNDSVLMAYRTAAYFYGDSTSMCGDNVEGAYPTLHLDGDANVVLTWCMYARAVMGVCPVAVIVPAGRDHYYVVLLILVWVIVTFVVAMRLSEDITQCAARGNAIQN